MKHAGADQFNRRQATRAIPARALVVALVMLFGADELLLWGFLGLASPAAVIAGALVVAALCWDLSSRMEATQGDDRVPLRTLAFCFAVAAPLLLLGGEGRVFYSNIDWQVRDAVLRDMAIHSWPFAYAGHDGNQVLRAPIGMYLVPALAFRAFGSAAGDWALFIQNSLLFAILMALASRLFAGSRTALTALVVFLVFSGLDILGASATHRLGDHLDAWAGTEFSSTLTLLFWVPHHALAGWIGAICYLLWEQRRAPVTLLFVLLPLTALWSPLALMGNMPFAIAAAHGAFRRREIAAPDLIGPIASCLLCAPALAYLHSGSGQVGGGAASLSLAQYSFFEAVEILPYLIPLAILALRNRERRLTLALTALCLLTAPLIRVGASVDFASRASIPSLAILAILTATTLSEGAQRAPRPFKVWLLIMLGIGSITGSREVARSLDHPASPRVTCPLPQAWHQSFAKYPIGSYLVPASALPPWIRPDHPTIVAASAQGKCWSASWYHPD